MKRSSSAEWRSRGTAAVRRLPSAWACLLAVLGIQIPATAEWNSGTVPDASSNYGVWSSIAIHGQVPVIAYHDASRRDLKLARRTLAGWAIETVDGEAARPGQVSAAGAHASMVLDAGGHPHVAYQSSDGLRWAAFDGNNWTYRKLNTSGGPIGISLALDHESHAHIAYLDLTEGSRFALHYVHWDGAGWDYNHQFVSSEVWNVTYSGTSRALALDSAGVPHIVFYSSTTGQLRLASLDAPPDSSDARWGIQDVTGATSAAYPSLCLNTNDRPRIAFQVRTDGDLAYAWPDGDEWQMTIVDDGGPQNHNVGANTCLVLDSQGGPHITYWDATVARVKYARLAGSTWRTEVVEGGELVGWFSTSVALDEGGAAHASYYEAHSIGGQAFGALHYAAMLPPALRIVRRDMDANVLEVSWPDWPPGFDLYTTTKLSRSVFWKKVARPPINFQGINSASFTSTPDARFFLLRRP